MKEKILINQSQYGFTGLSESGKSSIANLLEEILFENGINSYFLDGDDIRSDLYSDLSFSIVNRDKNIRRIREVVKIILYAGMIMLVSVISLYKYQRKMICKILGKINFLEVFVDTPIIICKFRDPKKLYKKAHTRKISDFIGLKSIYDIHKKPDILLNGTDSLENKSKKNNNNFT